MNIYCVRFNLSHPVIMTKEDDKKFYFHFMRFLQTSFSVSISSSLCLFLILCLSMVLFISFASDSSLHKPTCLNLKLKSETICSFSFMNGMQLYVVSSSHEVPQKMFLMFPLLMSLTSKTSLNFLKENTCYPGCTGGS